MLIKYIPFVKYLNILNDVNIIFFVDLLRGTNANYILLYIINK